MTKILTALNNPALGASGAQWRNASRRPPCAVVRAERGRTPREPRVTTIGYADALCRAARYERCVSGRPQDLTVNYDAMTATRLLPRCVHAQAQWRAARTMTGAVRSDLTHPHDRGRHLPPVVSRGQRVLAISRRLLEQLRRNWCWILVTGFLMYLGAFGFALWYVRCAVLIGTLAVSSTAYLRWTATQRAHNDVPPE